MKQKAIFFTIAILLLSCSHSDCNGEYFLFKWHWESNEKAFKILLPDGWITEGGIYRINPNTGGGAANALEAKLDYIIKNNNDATAMMRWYPDMFYFDPRYSPAGQMRLFPNGSNYQGMTVMPLLTPEQFIEKVVLPFAHPGATNVSVLESKNLLQFANAVQKEDNLLVNIGFKYSAAIVTINYMEAGNLYEEKCVAVILNLGQAGAGMWKNRYTFSIRALKGALKDYEPIFAAIGNSLSRNPQWQSGEIKGQLERAGIYNKTMTEINRISEEIIQHKQENNAAIQHDMYLSLTGQEEYVNPFTNEIETGTNQWNNRWSSNGDFVIYSDDPNFNPNKVKELNHFEYKKSPVKKDNP